MKPIPKITAKQENFRTEPFGKLPDGRQALIIRRDPVEPIPVGSYIAVVFQVTGYDRDCDGSLMARLQQVDKKGKTTGWEQNCIGLYPETEVWLDNFDELQKLAAQTKSTPKG